MTRQLEQSFAIYLAGAPDSALSGCSFRAGVPADALTYPAVIVAVGGETLLEGGVSRASRVDIDVSVVTAAGSAGWQTAHKARVAAISGLVDDTATQTALNAINRDNTEFTLYGWTLTELASETSPNHQTDSFRLNFLVGEPGNDGVSGKNEYPQTFSLRHELEETGTDHLITELPAAVVAAYDIQPQYSEAVADASRIVVSVASAEKPYPQMRRYKATMAVHVITAGHDATGHAATVQQVADTIRELGAQDFTTALLTVSGVLKAGHLIDIQQDRISDTLTLSVWCEVN